MPAETPLIKMSDLARLSGVPAPTIKHYLREGLLPEPAKRTSRNMAYYDPKVIPRIKAIKELQRTRFLPLRVIKDLLDGAEREAGQMTEIEVARVLQRLAPSGKRSRQELVAAGVPDTELVWYQQIGLVSPEGQGDDEAYSGDDLALVETLNDARKAGITRDMLPPTILQPYIEAIGALVRLEVEMFRQGVLPLAGDRLPHLVEAATVLSERLVVLLRRKMLLPTLRQAVADETAKPKARRRKKPA